MTQQSNLAELQSWWNELSFAGKELFHLNENGDIILLPLAEGKERTITTLTAEHADALVRPLLEKFAELESRVNEFGAEWNAADDKSKLAGKVERLKEALLHTAALGHFDTLLKQVQEWEQVLNAAIQENYNAKLAIVEKAEKLADSENWKETTQAFRDFVEQWKHTGSNAKGKNDVLWNRLEEARNKFYERKRQKQESVEHELMQNLDLKMELVEKAEALANSEDWKGTTEIFRKLMDEWKTIGRTMHDKNEDLWTRFINAKNNFFDKKKEHFDKARKEQEENYVVKSALLEKAEALKTSTDWANTTQAYADLMEQWKSVGRVPIDKADELWDKFTAAKEHFFQAKRVHFDSVRSTLDENLQKKRDLLQRTEDIKNSTQWREVAMEMNTLMEDWKKIGAVPREHSNKLWDAFLAARKHFFDNKAAYFEQRKKQAEKYAHTRSEQARGFLNTLIEEIRDEEEKLADFEIAIENITPGRKSQELRRHLEHLISEGEVRIARKREKLENVKKEIEEKEGKAKRDHGKDKKHSGKNGREPETEADTETGAE